MIDETPLQFEGEMPLGAADEDGLQEFSQCLVGDLGADAQTGDLLLVLDDPELFDRAREIRQAQPRDDRADGSVPADGEVVFLDGEGAGVLPRREVGRGDGRVAGGAGEGVDAQSLVGTAVQAVVQRTGAEQDVLAGAEQEDGAAGAVPAR